MNIHIWRFSQRGGGSASTAIRAYLISFEKSKLADVLWMQMFIIGVKTSRYTDLRVIA